MKLQRYSTIGLIGRETNIPPWRVRYFLNAKGVEPIGVAGHIRVYPPDAVEVVRRAAAESAARRGRKGGGVDAAS